MAKPFVSIIMNCYNGEKFLREAIESVLVQTFSNWEIIFWDNQSTDQSARIAKSFNDSRIKYFYAPSHTALGEARNLAFEKALGEWFGFLDCDDLWLPKKLEEQLKIIESCGPDVGLVYGRCSIFGDNLEETEIPSYFKGKPLPEGRILKPLILKGNFVPLLAALVRRRSLKEMGGIPVDFKISEDYFLFAGIASRYKVKAVQTICCKYRIHSSNNSRFLTLESFEEPIKVINSFKNFLNKKIQSRVEWILLKLHTYAGIENIKVGKFRKGFYRIFFQGSLIIFLLKMIKECLEFGKVFLFSK